MMHIVQNIEAKGEIGQHEQFLLLSQCFQTLSAADSSECICTLESVSKCLNLGRSVFVRRSHNVTSRCTMDVKEEIILSTETRIQCSELYLSSITKQPRFRLILKSNLNWF